MMDEESPLVGSSASSAAPKQRLVLFVAGLGVLSLIILVGRQHAEPATQPVAIAPLMAAQSEVDPVCMDPKFNKKSLKTAKETSAVALFADPKGQKKFEASGIIKVGNFFYVVFDNFYAIGRIDTHLPFNSERNVLVGEIGGDSGYEELVHDKDQDLFYLVKESTADGQDSFHAVVHEIKMTENSTEYQILRQCKTEFEFQSDNKGLEGAAGVRRNGEFYLLGLCEGNHCAAGSMGRDKGNGQIIVMKKRERDEGCTWITEQIINIPPEADFVDYSAMSLHKDGNGPTNLRVAVTSQESAQVWFGRLDTDNWVLTTESVYHFPRDNECNVIYCNIEGIHFLSDTLLAAVSDKMKGGKQSFRCLEKDQSVHLFVLP
jgi:hypothetical protein